MVLRFLVNTIMGVVIVKYTVFAYVLDAKEVLGDVVKMGVGVVIVEEAFVKDALEVKLVIWVVFSV